MIRLIGKIFLKNDILKWKKYELSIKLNTLKREIKLSNDEETELIDLLSKQKNYITELMKA